MNITGLINNVMHSGAVQNYIMPVRRHRGRGIRMTPQQACFFFGITMIISSVTMLYIAINRRNRNVVLRKVCTHRTTARVFFQVNNKKVLKYLDYTVDGRSFYNQITTMYSNRYRDRQIVNIIYNPNDPNQFYIEGENASSELIATIVFSVFLVISSLIAFYVGFSQFT